MLYGGGEGYIIWRINQLLLSLRLKTWYQLNLQAQYGKYRCKYEYKLKIQYQPSRNNDLPHLLFHVCWKCLTLVGFVFCLAACLSTLEKKALLVWPGNCILPDSPKLSRAFFEIEIFPLFKLPHFLPSYFHTHFLKRKSGDRAFAFKVFTRSSSSSTEKDCKN